MFCLHQDTRWSVYLQADSSPSQTPESPGLVLPSVNFIELHRVVIGVAADVRHGLEVCEDKTLRDLHHHRGQGNRSTVIKYCSSKVFGEWG